jgi:hypothetical protein
MKNKNHDKRNHRDGHASADEQQDATSPCRLVRETLGQRDHTARRPEPQGHRWHPSRRPTPHLRTRTEPSDSRLAVVGWPARVPSEDELRRALPGLCNVHDVVVAAVRLRLTPHLLYLDDAFSSAKSSPYQRPYQLLYALLGMDDVAWRWAEQLDGGPPLGALRPAFRVHGLTYKDGISSTTTGKWGGEYRHLHNGRRILFDAHINLGSKQAHKCLSIHFAWDDSERRVVVAHVGRHKTNTRS